MNKYIAHITLSVTVEAQDDDAAYLVAYDTALMDLKIIKSPFLIENIEIKDA